MTPEKLMKKAVSFEAHASKLKILIDRQCNELATSSYGTRAKIEAHKELGKNVPSIAHILTKADAQVTEKVREDIITFYEQLNQTVAATSVVTKVLRAEKGSVAAE